MIGQTTFSATARFEDGVATVKVTASTPYGSRTCGVSQEVDDEKLLGAIGGLMEKAIKSVRESLQQEAVKQTAGAIVAAANRKEVI